MKQVTKNLIEICKILSDLEFHDGDTIGNKLNITRSAVWKSIHKLQELGIEINSVKNKGYQFSDKLLLIDKDHIAKEINNHDIKIEVFESIDSTNNYLKKFFGSKERRICIAEMQTNGRGRTSKHWHSPFGQNIYFSYLYNFKKDISELNGLSLVVGIATIAAIKEIFLGFNLKLKWPNDGLYENKKFMGNLVELQSESYGDTSAIIGIGINVNMLNNQQDISQDWTSLRKIGGEYIDRNRLIISLIHNLNYHLEQFSKYGFKEFIAKWNELDYFFDKRIQLTDQSVGIAKGVNLSGHLLLELDNKEIRNISSGEASIVKL